MKKQRNQRKNRHHGPVSRQSKGRHPKGWVPVEVPDNLEEMLLEWSACEQPNVGFCFLCRQPIPSAANLIPNTNTHNCEAGRALEEKIRLTQAAKSNRKSSVQNASPASDSDHPGSSVAREPQVGIFWCINGMLITDT